MRHLTCTGSLLTPLHREPPDALECLQILVAVESLRRAAVRHQVLETVRLRGCIHDLVAFHALRRRDRRPADRAAPTAADAPYPDTAVRSVSAPATRP